MTDLSPTFRDAFDVTRKLGVRYLWIDSLCIIQDSDSDWRAESSVMGEIYAQSLCNIAATGSSQNFGGLFQERDISKVAPTATIKLKGKTTTYCFKEGNPWCTEITNAPLNNRGWVLQERMLSRRTLHYASQLFWECQTMQACESFPSGMPGMWCDPRWRCGYPPSSHPLTFKTWEMKSTAGWDEIMRSYARCKLTRASDRLVAIAGIAKAVQSLGWGNYLAGLWKEELPRCLVWSLSTAGGLKRPEQYQCEPPSSVKRWGQGLINV
jgi:hypothetical protein